MNAYTVKIKTPEGARILCVIAPDSISAGLIAMDKITGIVRVSVFPRGTI